MDELYLLQSLIETVLFFARCIGVLLVAALVLWLARYLLEEAHYAARRGALRRGPRRKARRGPDGADGSR